MNEALCRFGGPIRIKFSAGRKFCASESASSPSAKPLGKNEIENLVEQIITTRKQNPAANTHDLETQIDQLVYELYGLTEQGIKLVEGV